MANDFLIFPEDESWGDFPDSFLGSEDGQQVIDELKDIRKAVGSPLQPLISDLETITKRGQAADLRGIRFASGSQALLWLFHRGIFLFSNIVQMPDGTWGVRIGRSDQAELQTDIDDDLEGDEDLVF